MFVGVIVGILFVDSVLLDGFFVDGVDDEIDYCWVL